MKRFLSIFMAVLMILGMTATVSLAENGPSEEQWDEGSYFAYLLFARVDENGDVVHDGNSVEYYAFKDNEAKGEMDGAVYDRASNTLTITNLDKPDFILECNAMGEDFTIKVEGECSLARICVWGWQWGAGLKVTGSGKLTLNEKRSRFCAISSTPEGAPAPKIEFGADVTVDMYSSGSVMAVYDSDSENSPFIFGSEPTEAVQLEKEQAKNFVYQNCNVYMGEQQTRRFRKVNRASDPEGVYGALETIWFKDFEAGIIDYEGYTVYKLVYVASVDAWVFDPSFGAEFGDYPTEADLSTEEFEAAGFSVVTDEYGHQVWGDYTMPGAYFSSTLYTDGTNDYFCYYDWDDELNEPVMTYYHIIPVEGLEETYIAGDPAEGVKEGEIYPAVEEITVDGIYNYIVQNSELHVGPGGAPKIVFSDVKKGAFYYDAVYWAVDRGITNGTSATTFSPNANCTRGQVVTFLWRAAGSPKPKTTANPFTDVKKGAFYYDAVLWAVETGVTSGTSATTFSPSAPCTRSQVVTFLWRAKGSPAPKTTSTVFKDVSSGGFYYKAMLWAIENNVTNGMSPTAFGPNNVCTRGQVVTFLMRAFAE